MSIIAAKVAVIFTAP